MGERLGLLQLFEGCACCRTICHELLQMLRPETASQSNRTLKILDGPIHLGAMAETQETTVEDIKSIWVATRDDSLVGLAPGVPTF